MGESNARPAAYNRRSSSHNDHRNSVRSNGMPGSLYRRDSMISKSGIPHTATFVELGLTVLQYQLCLGC